MVNVGLSKTSACPLDLLSPHPGSQALGIFPVWFPLGGTLQQETASNANWMAPLSLR